MSRNLKGVKDSPTNFNRRKAFADRVQRRLMALDLSQSELARLLDIDQSAVNRWLNPARGYSLPEATVIMDLPEALQCSFRWLLTGEGPLLPETTSESEAYRLGAKTAYAEVMALTQGRIEGLNMSSATSPVSRAELEAAAYRARIGQEAVAHASKLQSVGRRLRKGNK